MDFDYSDKVNGLRRRIQDFMDSYVLPANPEWHREAAGGRFPLRIVNERKVVPLGTPDTPLSWLWTWGRALRFLDGPDEVHLRTVAKNEINKAKDNRGASAAYFTLHGDT